MRAIKIALATTTAVAAGVVGTAATAEACVDNAGSGQDVSTSSSSTPQSGDDQVTHHHHVRHHVRHHHRHHHGWWQHRGWQHGGDHYGPPTPGGSSDDTDAPSTAPTPGA